MGPQYVQASWRNQDEHPPEELYLLFAVVRTELPPGLFGGLASLTKLSCFGNRLARLDPGLLAPLTSLQILYAPWAVQCHPHGSQLDFAWPSARTMHPHGDASYVWCLTA